MSRASAKAPMPKSSKIRNSSEPNSKGPKLKPCGPGEVELQIGLKDYDTQRDKRFAGGFGDAGLGCFHCHDGQWRGTIKLPHVPRPRLKARNAEARTPAHVVRYLRGFHFQREMS